MTEFESRRETLVRHLDRFPRATLAHVPTPLEPMENLSRALDSPPLWVKRDDCTGLAFGGNKVRQLEFYFGAAQASQADTVLITGAVDLEASQGGDLEDRDAGEKQPPQPTQEKERDETKTHRREPALRVEAAEGAGEGSGHTGLLV